MSYDNEGLKATKNIIYIYFVFWKVEWLIILSGGALKPTMAKKVG